MPTGINRPQPTFATKSANSGLGEVKRSPCGFSAISPSVITHLSLLPCQPNRQRLTIFIKKARALVIQT